MAILDGLRHIGGEHYNGYEEATNLGTPCSIIRT